MGLTLTRTSFLGMVAAGSLGVAGLSLATAAGSSAGAAGAATAAHPPATHVSIRVTPWLTQGGASRGHSRQIDYRAGLTPAAVAEAQGIRGSDLGSVMAVVNGVQADLAAPLAAGDQLELITGMAGG